MKIFSDINYILRFNNSDFFIYNYGGLFNLKLNNRYKSFNLQDPLEKTLSRIYSFYEVLNNLEVGPEDYTLLKLEHRIKHDPDNAINWEGQEDMGSFHVSYEKEINKILAGYSEYQYGQHIQGLEKGDEDNRYEEYTKQEFYLLMQIYYGLYQEEELRKKLEKQLKNGEIKKGIKEEKIGETRYKVDYDENWSKLELMRKDTSGAFNGLEIKKIYDKNWREEEQRKYIDKINKEYGEEVIVYEDKESKKLNQEKKQKKEPAKKGFLDKIKSVFKR